MQAWSNVPFIMRPYFPSLPFRLYVPKTTEMKQFFTILLSAILSVATANAQSFLDRLQTQTKGKGSVTVTQSADIDRLVNGTAYGTAAAAVQKKPVESKPSSVSGANTGTVQAKTTEKPTQHHTTAATAKAGTSSPKAETGTTEAEVRTADPRPKVMGNSHKVNGYRVQAFAGGNTRADKQKAQRIGNAIKASYPDEPVYVHFYSPRWICRVGNYRTYEEAHKMLLELRELGYKQALIVKGKITVQY